jgi:hypothetical protein
MQVFRVIKNKNYTTICNGIYKDKALSLKAKGLLSMILSLPADWDLTINGLVKICKEGKRAMTSIISELIAAGYITRQQVRKNGSFAGYDYCVYEHPQRLNAAPQDAPTQKSNQLSNKEINTLSNKDNINIRKQIFVNNVETLNILNQQEKEKFIDYWTETNKSGKKMLYEMQRTFDIKLRLKRWAANNQNWNNKGRSKLESQLCEYNKGKKLLK